MRRQGWAALRTRCKGKAKLSWARALRSKAKHSKATASQGAAALWHGRAGQGPARQRQSEVVELAGVWWG